MARLKQFTVSLLSGYLQMGANILFTLVSVPLGLAFLSKAEFGIFALATQVVSYFALVDFGMAGAVSRILIDHKDHPENRAYGSVIQTGFWLLTLQGIVIIGLGFAMALAAGLFDVPESLLGPFRLLIVLQACVMGGTLPFRFATLILAAHQRFDVNNYLQGVGWILGVVALWIFFATGFGVYSFAWALLVTQLPLALGGVAAVFRLGLLPASEDRGKASWATFKELFSYGRDMFLYSLGNQLLHASQVILVSRLVSVEAGAVWSICMRTFGLALQSINRIFDFSCSALAEMLVRNERERLRERFRAMVVFVGSLGCLMGVMFGVGNQSFVAWWTGGAIGWPRINDGLLGVWLLLVVLVRCHSGLIGLTKEFRWLRYVYFAEGLVFVLAAWWVLPRWGITGMVICSIAASLSLSFPYSLWRTSQLFEISCWTALCVWMRPTLRLGGLLLALAVLVAWPVNRAGQNHMQAFLWLGLLGIAGTLLFLRWGTEKAFQQEMARRMPASLAWVARWLARR